MIAGIESLACIAVATVFPHMGGHGTFSFIIAAPFMLVGRLVGCVLAGLSVLAAKPLERGSRFAMIYVYGWCFFVFAFGVSFGIFGIPLNAVGILVWLVRRDLLHFSKKAVDEKLPTNDQ